MVSPVGMMLVCTPSANCGSSAAPRARRRRRVRRRRGGARAGDADGSAAPRTTSSPREARAAGRARGRSRVRALRRAAGPRPGARPTRARLARVAAASAPSRVPGPRRRFSHATAARPSCPPTRAAVSQQRWRKAAERVTRRLAGGGEHRRRRPGDRDVQVNHQVQHDLTRAEAIAFPVLFLLALFVFRSVVAALLPLVWAGSRSSRRCCSCACSTRSRRSRPTRSTSSPAPGSGSRSTTACCWSPATARSSAHGPGADAVRATLRTAGPDGRVLVGHGRRRGRDARRLPARVPALDGHRRRPRRAARRADRADRPARTLRPARAARSTRSPVRGAGRRRGRRRRAAGTGWRTRIMRRPVPVAVAATTLLVVLGIPFLSMRFTGVDAAVLPPGAARAWSTTALRRDFTPTFTLARVRRRARRRRGGGRYAAAVQALPGTGARAAAAPPRARSVGGARRRRAARSWRSRLEAARPGDARACRRRARRRRDRAVPRPEALDRLEPAARDRPALRRHVRAALPGDAPVARLPLKTLVMNLLTLSPRSASSSSSSRTAASKGCSTTAARAPCS